MTGETAAVTWQVGPCNAGMLHLLLQQNRSVSSSQTLAETIKSESDLYYRSLFLYLRCLVLCIVFCLMSLLVSRETCSKV